MNASEAVERFRAKGTPPSTAVRLVGYAALVQRCGWKRIFDLMDRESAQSLVRAFQDAEIDPLNVDLREGDRAYLEEVVRSSAHAEAAELAEKILE